VIANDGLIAGWRNIIVTRVDQYTERAYPIEAERAVAWAPGTIVDLGTLPGGDWSRAEAINDQGLIVGISGTDGEEGWHAFAWTGFTARMTDLGTLPGVSKQAVQHIAAVNATGLVLGTSQLANGYTRATLWRVRQ
jgi:probable HAF family extracellular repeat protein